MRSEPGKPPPSRSRALGKIDYPEELPISQRREEILAAIRRHPVIVLTGETGSGKTTQIPKMCLEAGLGAKGRIACTQPRRVAALSVAKRVAEELGVDFGAEVGAKIRFTDQTSRQTRVKFMTDGILLSEIQSDPLLRDYEAIIIDEAHERSLNIDFLLGHLNQLRKRRPRLKIIITSATIDSRKFSESFDNAPIIEVSGRVYPVDIIYAPLEELLEEGGDFTYIEGIAESAARIQAEFGHGDILAFLPTEKDIRESQDLLAARFRRGMEIIPCFGRLSNADQQRIFLPSAKRKLVLATNIAETSLTIPGIRFVIDTGLARISRYNPRGRTKRLPIAKVSQASANQRSGRCGRVADGICIRLYSEKDYLSRPAYSTPEIQRANLAEVILRMLASRLGQVENFPFIDPPSAAAISSGLQLLQELGALEAPPSATQGAPRTDKHLTPLGRQLAKLPVDPTVGRMLLDAQDSGVTHEVLVIASALSIQDPRERPMEKEAAARQAHASFEHKHSDFLTLLNIWEALQEEFEAHSQSHLRRFCKQHFLNYLRVREWREVYQQLERSLPSGKDRARTQTAKEAPDLSRDGAAYQHIHTALLSGLLANIGRREENNLYRFSANRKPLVFPGSALFIRQARDKKTGKRRSPGTEAGANRRKSPDWILCGEVVETNRIYARTVAAIDPAWILAAGDHILTRRYSDPQYLPDQSRVVARESTRIHGLEIQSKNVSYLKIDPDKATEIFLRETLLNDDFDAPANWSFLVPNRRLISRIQNAQTVISVAHWMGVEEAAYAFYRARIPACASVHDLNRQLKKPAYSDRLLMQESDLTFSTEAAVDLSQFPETVQLENSALPIQYHYKHGDARDGVTLSLPYHRAKSIDKAMLDWLIPGHLEAKVHALLKALPKSLRHQLAPLADSSKAIASQLRPTGNSLTDSLRDHLKEQLGIETYHSDWQESAIPAHLQVRVEARDIKGNIIAEARDLRTLQKKLNEHEATLSLSKAPDTNRAWTEARERIECQVASLSQLESHCSKHGVQAPLKIGEANGVPLFAFPGLRVAGGGTDTSLQLVLLPAAQEARLCCRRGISALLEHELRRELAWLRRDLKEVARIGPLAVAFRPIAALQEDLYLHLQACLCKHAIESLDIPAIRKQVEAARIRSKTLLYKTLDQLKPILQQRQALMARAEVAKQYADDIERIAPPDFLRSTPHEQLSRLPLYLAAIEHRHKSRERNPLRDEERQRQVQLYLDRLRQCEKIASGDSLKAEELQQLRWMIEEFAISLFAQHLRAAFPISKKKLDKAFAQLEASPATPASATPEKTLAPRASAAKSVAAKKPDRPTQADLDSLRKRFK